MSKALLDGFHGAFSGLRPDEPRKKGLARLLEVDVNVLLHRGGAGRRAVRQAPEQRGLVTVLSRRNAMLLSASCAAQMAIFCVNQGQITRSKDIMALFSGLFMVLLLGNVWLTVEKAARNRLYGRIFFFVLGGYIALEYKSILYKKYSQKIIAILKFCIWLIFCGFLVEYNLGYYSHCIGILLGIWSLWCMYDVLYSYIRRINNLKKLAGYSFFIYVAHEPLLTVIKKLLLCIGGSPIMILIIYFMAPLITICVCVVIGCLLKDRFPKFYAFISGGR